jgi:NAD(P) transhydrogenase subunit alpha
MIIGVLKEVLSNENRVSISPDIVVKLTKLGYSVQVEKDAGLKSNFTNNQYIEVGATIIDNPEGIWQSSDIILKVNGPSESSPNETAYLTGDKTLISFFGPAQHLNKLKLMAHDNVNLLAMDSVPRLSRAQKMDALSSMANVAGSRAVIEASHKFGRFFGGQITAAGKIPPAKVLVIGAGVAGLSAIGTANNLGAIVRAFDTRMEVKEEVESLHAEFLMIGRNEDGSGKGGYAKEMSDDYQKKQEALLAETLKEMDIVICTAQIPGRKAPLILKKDMLDNMKQGSVIIDLAVESGGNCEYSQLGKVVSKNGLKIVGHANVPGRVANNASSLFAKNVSNFLKLMNFEDKKKSVINKNDEIIKATLICSAGKNLIK